MLYNVALTVRLCAAISFLKVIGFMIRFFLMMKMLLLVLYKIPLISNRYLAWFSSL